MQVDATVTGGGVRLRPDAVRDALGWELKQQHLVRAPARRKWRSAASVRLCENASLPNTASFGRTMRMTGVMSGRHLEALRTWF